MYCSNCGFNNKEDAKFCENCGFQLISSTTTPVTNPSDTPTKSSWRKWSSIGAAIVVICFFLPWVSVSCAGRQVVSLTGGEIATGSYSEVQAYPAVFLLPLIGAIGFIAINGKRESSIISIIVGGLGCVGLLILMSSIGSMKNQTSSGGVLEINYEIGIWGQWVGNIIQIGLGYLSRNE
jgi:hypothetical protein